MADQASPAQRRLRATVEYDGADFVGWQAQDEERGRSVQSVLEQAIERITGQAAQVVGSGRTDAGVHATGQVVHFDTPWPRGLAELERAINAVLPPDVVLTELAAARADFHARYDARTRVYVYTILNQPRRSPLQRRAAWHVTEPLDAGRMQAAGQRLVGRHDFRAFGRPMKAGGSTARTVVRVAVEAEPCAVGQTLRVTVQADAFLRHMVRRLVYALVEAGRGRLTPDEVEAIRASADPARLHGIAPPQGLCLVRVSYDETER